MSDVSLGGCVSYGNVTLHTGPRGVHCKVVAECPTCQRRTPMVLVHDGVWYGSHRYCISCLDGWWSEGYRMERPFQRYWKRDRAAKIKALWDSALTRSEYQEWVKREISRYLDDEEAAL